MIQNAPFHVLKTHPIFYLFLPRSLKIFLLITNLSSSLDLSSSSELPGALPSQNKYLFLLRTNLSSSLDLSSFSPSLFWPVNSDIKITFQLLLPFHLVSVKLELNSRSINTTMPISFIYDSSTGRFASRSNRTPYRMNTNATTSRPIDPTDLDDNYMSEVPSSFPNVEVNYMSGYQHLLASESYPGEAGDNKDEENDIDDPINQNGNNDQNKDCLQSDNGPNSSGNNVCIKRKGLTPNRYQRQLSLYGRTEFNNASCGREIGNILRCNFKGPWHCWEKVDSMYKDELFKEFKKKYAFPEEDEEIVRNIWEYKAWISLNQQLARARTKALSKLNTANIIDCMNNDGKISSHSGGSVSFASYRASMQQQAGGKELPWDDVFSMLHQNVNETGTFVDNRSKTVVENYRNEMIAKYGPDRDVHPSFDGEAWHEASRGISKGRVYSAPHMPKSKVSASSSQHSYSVHSTYPSTVIQELKDELQIKDALLSNMQRQINSITNYLGAQHGSSVRPEFMSQGMSTPVDMMPSHTMAPMGPVSSLVYRP
uniref:Uncharacterized protein n=1 Tax=Salix viminalis TaxID=40686 RepID=A0A6N2K9F1_SALVM